MEKQASSSVVSNPLCLPSLTFSGAIEATISFIRVHAQFLVPIIVLVSFPIALVQNFVLNFTVGSLGLTVVNGQVRKEEIQAFIDRSGSDITTVFGLLAKIIIYQVTISILVSVVLLIVTMMVQYLIWKFATGITPTNAEAFAFAKQNFWGMLLVSILVGFSVFFGLILFIIPGIILAIRLSLASWIYIIEGKKGNLALKESKALVKDNTWTFLLYLAGIGILSAIISGFIVSIVGVLGDNIVVRSLATSLSSCVQIIPLVFSAILYFTLRNETPATTLEQ